MPRGNIGVRPATRADAYGFLTARRAVVRWAFAMFGEYISYFCIGRPVGKRPVAGVGLAVVCLAWRLEGVPRGRYACVACCPFGFCAQDVAALPARKREGEADERSDGERTGGGLKIAGLLHGGACGVGRSRYEPLQGRRSQCLRGRCGGVSDTVRNSSSVFPVWRHAGGRAGESTLKE